MGPTYDGTGDVPIRSGTCGHEPPRGTGSDRAAGPGPAPRSAGAAASARVIESASVLSGPGTGRAAGGRARPRRTRPGSGAPVRRPPARARGSRGCRSVVSSPKSASRTCGLAGPVGVEQQVGRLHVPVHDADGVHGDERLEQLVEHDRDVRLRQPAAARLGGRAASRRGPASMTTSDVVARRPTGRGQDVRMLERAGRPVTGGPGGEHLDRDVPPPARSQARRAPRRRRRGRSRRAGRSAWRRRLGSAAQARRSPALSTAAHDSRPPPRRG